MERIKVCVRNMVDMVRRGAMKELTSLQRLIRRVLQRTAEAYRTCVSELWSSLTDTCNN